MSLERQYCVPSCWVRDTPVWRQNPWPDAMDGVLLAPNGSWIFIWYASTLASIWPQTQGQSATLIAAGAPAVPPLVGMKCVNGVRQSPGVAYTGPRRTERTDQESESIRLMGSNFYREWRQCIGQREEERNLRVSVSASRSPRDHTNRSDPGTALQYRAESACSGVWDPETSRKRRMTDPYEITGGGSTKKSIDPAKP